MLSWKQVKELIEEQGVNDDTLIESIDIPFGSDTIEIDLSDDIAEIEGF